MNTEGFVVDASVALKWFTHVDEAGVDLALAMVGRLELKTTTLAIYEIGARLARSRDKDPARVSRALDQVREICGDPADLQTKDYLRCSTLARREGLTFYDASYVAIAERLGRRVVSADRDLIDPGLAVDLETALASA